MPGTHKLHLLPAIRDSFGEGGVLDAFFERRITPPGQEGFMLQATFRRANNSGNIGRHSSG
jgi:hypothetical protein